MRDSPALLHDLRRLARFGKPAPVEAGQGEGDWLHRGLGPGRLHEVYGTDEGDAAAAAGFAVAQAIAGRAVPIVWLRGQARGSGHLHATGLAELGLLPDTLVMVVATDAAALLRAAADVARCRGIGTLVMESRGPMPALDLTATRRLVLAAEASGVTVVSLRCGAEPVPSAAATRWRVAAGPSTALDANAPGRPAFLVECLRRRGGPAGAARCVEWNRDARCFCPQDRSEAGSARPLAPACTPPLAGAGLPVAADRSAAGDPPAPLRATG